MSTSNKEIKTEEAKILSYIIRCPITNQLVSIALASKTEQNKTDDDEYAVKFDCPVCGKEHIAYLAR
jgi:predicted RNA-binding Zn-ribbon protein involved in translation (DUF1610 family)